MKSILQFAERSPAPSLLPILRSQQWGEILALLLGDPDLELSLTDIAARTGAPHPSVYREIERAEQAGLVTTLPILRSAGVAIAEVFVTADFPYMRGVMSIEPRYSDALAGAS